MVWQYLTPLFNQRRQGPKNFIFAGSVVIHSYGQHDKDFSRTLCDTGIDNPEKTGAEC